MLFILHVNHWNSNNNYSLIQISDRLQLFFQ